MLPAGAQQQTRRPPLSIYGTDGRTDTRPLHRIGLQGGEIKTRPRPSTAQMLLASLPKRLRNYRMLPKFIKIWQMVYWLHWQNFERHVADNYY